MARVKEIFDKSVIWQHFGGESSSNKEKESKAIKKNKPATKEGSNCLNSSSEVMIYKNVVVDETGKQFNSPSEEGEQKKVMKC